MTNLTFCNATSIEELAWPEDKEEITTNSAAIKVFTDFNIVKPLIIDASISAIEAERLMQKAHVRLKLVVDKDNHFLGVVSLDDLNNQAMIKKMSDGYKRDELSVTDFMRPRHDLVAFMYSELKKASIGDVIESLKKSGQQHCLVIDRELNNIRGIISASDVVRKLKMPIDIATNSSFVGIFNAICC